MTVSNRIKNGSITHGSAVTNAGLDTVTGSMDAFKQGIDVVTIGDLTNHVAWRIRPNTDFTKILNNRVLPENMFDDSLSLNSASSGSYSDSTASVTGSAGSKFNLAGTGRLENRVSHRIEQRDLGQSEPFLDHFYRDTDDYSPVGIVKNYPMFLQHPYSMLDISSEHAFDGVIEPLEIRRVVDRSTMEVPFVAHDIHGSIEGQEDAYRRVALITDGVEIEEIRDKKPVAFLDSVESMGSIDIPGAFMPETATIVPFEDSDDRFASTVGISGDIRRIFMLNSSFKDDDSKDKEIMAPRGFIFHYDENGYDSIAFGGLKK